MMLGRVHAARIAQRCTSMLSRVPNAAEESFEWRPIVRVAAACAILVASILTNLRADAEVVPVGARVSLVASPNAEGCATTPLACNGSARGRLGVGDCTFSDGTYYDRYTFAGTAGEVVRIDVRPLAQTFTRPLLVLAPPIGDASKTPLIYGGNGTAVLYVLSSTGTWAFAVGTADPFAAGEYFVSLQCSANHSPSQPQSCIEQKLVCNQTAAWYLTQQSCRFADGSAAYQDFEIYGIAGDTATVTETSSSFRPAFGVLQESTNQYVGNATLIDSATAKQVVTFPATGRYAIVASSYDDQQIGFFSLEVKCAASGCLSPLITSQPPTTTTIAYGAQASLSFGVNGSPPLTFNWIDQVLNYVGSMSTLTTTPLFATSRFFATVSNACGSASTQSASVIVLPPSPPTIAFFSANPTTVKRGMSATLSWTTTDATSVTITPNLGGVAASGSITVTPQQTTVFTLIATNSVGTAQAQVTVVTETTRRRAVGH